MKLIERRVGLLFAVFTIAFCGVLARAAWLQAVQGGELSADARSQQTAAVTVPGIRGAILDRNGRALAASQNAATIIVTPYQIEDPPKAAEQLAEKLDAKPEDVLETITADSGFEYLARQVDLVTAEKVRKLDLVGVGILPDSRRLYPEQIDGRLIGAVGTDGLGLFGIEALEEDVLSGANGELAVTRDALGEEISRDTIEGAVTGEDVRLTIDARIQAQTEKVLGEVGDKYDPNGATAIAVNPQDGSVLAMASWPPVDATDLDGTDPENLGNMATGFTYEPGSTFKAFTIGGALEDGVVSPDTAFDLPSTIQVADRVIEESHDRGPMTMTTAEILKVSSNVGAVTIGLKLNGGAFGDRFDHWVRRFGFSKPTGIDFPGEERGIVPAPKDYSGSTMGNLPIGQGLSVTPLQMIAAYSAIANGGTLRAPHLVDTVGGEPAPPPAGKRIISPKTSRQLRTMLEGVLEPGGTASVEIPGYVLAGKTGTSQKVVDGEYSDTQFIASFVGFAPADHPELLVAVIVDDPKGDYYGGSVAAPAFGEIAQFALQYLGVEPD